METLKLGSSSISYLEGMKENNTEDGEVVSENQGGTRTGGPCGEALGSRESMRELTQLVELRKVNKE